MRLSDGGRALLAADGGRVPFSVTAKIPSNLSYYDVSSVSHFSDRLMRLRGRMEGDRFVARTIWPEDYALDFATLPYQPLGSSETLFAQLHIKMPVVPNTWIDDCDRYDWRYLYAG